ncbi:MAG: hypothetical protein J1F10_07305 [Muribaculaceae bacterium]|nr:hypothetical protein [Muribaculaceae bacterium]
MMRRLLLTFLCISTISIINAQNDILKITFSNGATATYKVDDISEMTFETESSPDTIVFKEFKGYTTASSRYFTDLFSGGSSTLTVCTVGNEYIVKYSDTTWGDGIFSNVAVGATLSGDGYLDIAYNGAPVKRYEATIGGAMTSPEITIPGIMSGCTLKFIIGSPSNALLYAGSYSGTNSVVVGGAFTYTADIDYKITANVDGTINIEVPEYSLANTVMGNLQLGKYTISNIAYNSEKNGFYREYGTDGIKQHFSAEQNGSKTMDGDYELNGNSNILIEKNGNSIIITNSFSLGAMPFPIVATFTNSVN